MIYLDHGATSFPKPSAVRRAMAKAMAQCANPGRGGHRPAMAAAEVLFDCRERAAELFGCRPEQVAFTPSCTQSLNIAIDTLVRPGDRVVISGFEHNAVLRPLHGLGAQIRVAGRKLFDQADTLSRFQEELKRRPAAAIFTHVSNAFGYILPVEALSDLCRQYGVPFVMDAAQSAGTEPLNMEKLGAEFIAIPGHKGLLGPMGTGLILCGGMPAPFCYGGTGSESIRREMPDFLPDRLEAGTANVSGIAGLAAGLRIILEQGCQRIRDRELRESQFCVRELKKRGFRVFSGPNQGGTVSFLNDEDPEILAEKLGRLDVAVRAGLHCAPLAHESAGTLTGGTVRVSFGYYADRGQTEAFLHRLDRLCAREM